MRRLKPNAVAFPLRNERIIAWRTALVVAISCAALALATDARATTLTFDDLPTPGTDWLPIPNGYGGFNWANFGYLDPLQRKYGSQDSGCYHGMVSPPNVAYNPGGSPATVSGPQFTFNSAYFTGAWNDGLAIQVTGYRAGVLVDTTSFTVDVTAPTFEQFNWSGIDQLVFSSSGGVYHGWGQGEMFAMDNMSITTTPEPTTLVLLAVGAASLLAFGWRRRCAD